MRHSHSVVSYLRCHLIEILNKIRSNSWFFSIFVRAVCIQFEPDKRLCGALYDKLNSGVQRNELRWGKSIVCSENPSLHRRIFQKFLTVSVIFSIYRFRCTREFWDEASEDAAQSLKRSLFGLLKNDCDFLLSHLLFRLFSSGLSVFCSYPLHVSVSLRPRMSLTLIEKFDEKKVIVSILFRHYRLCWTLSDSFRGWISRGGIRIRQF